VTILWCILLQVTYEGTGFDQTFKILEATKGIKLTCSKLEHFLLPTDQSQRCSFLVVYASIMYFKFQYYDIVKPDKHLQLQRKHG